MIVAATLVYALHCTALAPAHNGLWFGSALDQTDGVWDCGLGLRTGTLVAVDGNLRHTLAAWRESGAHDWCLGVLASSRVEDRGPWAIWTARCGAEPMSSLVSPWCLLREGAEAADVTFRHLGGPGLVDSTLTLR
ncbi:hypothetical protein NUW58_g4457 [Xylaria curta]|uniref:Uncharacterized protein n=1 Tax=Xylaria curta TaxID=42375 RepID=A0ACC1P7T6_9PEZI|nr:hypothetical protein NUW58_g4457 [Xylaria curta]